MPNEITLTGLAAINGTTNGNNFSGTGTVTGSLVLTGGVVADATGLAAYPSTSSVTLQWTPPAGSLSFIVDRREVVTGVTPTNSYADAVTISGSSMTISGLTPGRSYQFRVRANFTNAGVSTGTAVISTLPELTFVPSQPTAFRVTDASTTTLSVAWNAAANADNYRVWIRPTSGSYGASPNATSAGTSYTFVGLTAQVSYTMKVAGVSASTEGPASEIVFTTPAGALADPSGLAITAFTDSTAALSWVAGSGAATYLVDYLPTGGSYSIPIETTAISVSVLNLTPGVEYTFRVRSRAGSTISTGVTVVETMLGASGEGGGSGIAPTEVVVGSYVGGTSFNVTRPATSSGESYYIFVSYKNGDTQTLTTPAGYTLVADVNGTGHAGRCVLYEKVSSGELAGTVTITVSGAIDAAWAVLRTRGARRAYATVDLSFLNPFIAPSVTTTTVNAPVFNFVASGQWPRTFTAPAGITLLGQSYSTNGPAIAVGYTTVNAAASGAQSYPATDPSTGLAAGDDMIGVSLALDGAAIASVLSDEIDGSSVVADIPAANADDSLFLAVSYQDSSARTVATPSTWTLVDSSETVSGGGGATKGKLVIFSKNVATATAQTTQTVTFSGAVTGAYTASRHRGAYRAVAKTAGVSSVSFVAPSVTAATAASTLLSWVSPGHYPRTHTPPAGMTLEVDQTGGGVDGPSLAFGTKSVAAGATGTQTWTADSADDYNAISIVIDGTGGDTGGGGTTPGGGGNLTASFTVGSHVHGYGVGDRHSSGSWPGTNGPAGDNTMYPAKFGSWRSWDNESGIPLLAYWTGRTGGIDAAGDALNTYDYTAVNAVLDKMNARGHAPFMLTFNGTPAWAARNQDASSYGNGRMSIPTNITAWAQAVRDCVIHVRARYGNASVGWVEIGNECIGNESGSLEIGQFLNARGWPAGSSTPLATLLADMVGAVAPMVRTIDPAIKLVSGAHTYTNEYWTKMVLNARTQAGVRMMSLIDVFSVHLYGHSTRSPYRNLTAATEKIRQWMTETGYASMPLIDTEWGFYYPWGSSEETNWFNALGAQQRADYVYEAVAEYKRLGYLGVFWYSCDAAPAATDLSFFFRPEADAPMRAALNKAFEDFQS
jgi:hypothetical protein